MRDMTLGLQSFVRCAQVAAMYALAFGLVLIFWVLSDSNQWAGGFTPLDVRVMIALWQAVGPFALVFIYPEHPILLFSVVWGFWLALVSTTRLRNWPLFVHFLAAMLWCATGFPPASLVIT